MEGVCTYGEFGGSNSPNYDIKGLKTHQSYLDCLWEHSRRSRNGFCFKIAWD
jgi:hypothetical protein